MTPEMKELAINLCKRFPVDLADAEGIINFVRASCTPSEKKDAEGYPGIAHDFEAMRSVLQQVSTYTMGCRCSLRERDSGHRVDCHVPEFHALQEMARNAIKVKP